MKDLTIFMKAVADGLKSLAQGVESLAEKIEKVESMSQDEKPPEKKSSRGRPRGSKLKIKPEDGVRDTSKIALDQIYQTISNATDGIDCKTIKKITGYDSKSIHNLVYRLKKDGKIIGKGKGVYIKT